MECGQADYCGLDINVIGGAVYNLYEKTKDCKPRHDSPCPENPYPEKPCTENEAQLNKYKLNTKKSSKEVSNTQSIRRQAAKAKTIGLIGSKKRAPLNINYKNYPVNFDDVDLTVVK